MVNECLRWGAFAAVVVPVALLLTGGSPRTAALSSAATAGLTALIFVLTRLIRLRLPYLDRTEDPPILEPEAAAEPPHRLAHEERWGPVLPDLPTLPSPLAPAAYVEDQGTRPPLGSQPYGPPPYGSPYAEGPYDEPSYEPGPYEPATYEPPYAAGYDLPPYMPYHDEAAGTQPFVAAEQWPPDADWDPFQTHGDATHFAADPGLDLYVDEHPRPRRRRP